MTVELFVIVFLWSVGKMSREQEIKDLRNNIRLAKQNEVYHLKQAEYYREEIKIDEEHLRQLETETKTI